tara:strand:- start:1599 stop:2828 length:1230 start_codon:yes stop_codon:yes gene_type:complete
MEAYPDNQGAGHISVTDYHFAERTHYGVIDNENNAIIPNEDFIVEVGNFRMFDFVADSYSLAKLNCLVAKEKGQLSNGGVLSEGFGIMSAYQNPRVKYGKYLDDIFQFYNETHIPNSIGTNSITSYQAYVNNFFSFFLNQDTLSILTLTKWVTSNKSSILDTGLGFSYADIPYDHDQRKIDEIIDSYDFEYIKNLALNTSFSIMKFNPNILIYDLNGPAGESIRGSYGLVNLDTLFKERFIKTCTLDNDILYNKINIYYNKYVEKNYLNRVLDVEKCKTVSSYFTLEKVSLSNRPYSDDQENSLYIQLRNKEEGSPFSQPKLKEIHRKSKYFTKRLDKPSAISYINNMFRDQIWNKNNGYHDIKAKIEGRSISQSPVVQNRTPTGQSSSNRRNTSRRSSSGGRSGGSSY